MTDQRQFPTWQDYYQSAVEQMPWYYPELDPDLKEALDARAIFSGRLLDVGTGPGTQAVELARRGLDVVGTDIAAGALAQASDRARRENVHVTFCEDDILDSALTGKFDWAFDRGCFHVFKPEQRATYAAQLYKLLRPHGLLFLKCFSHLQPGDRGPHRFSSHEIHGIFAGRWKVLSIHETVYHGTLQPLPKALFCVLERL
jgi:cyclopropane fatty-acyl-phospholipid synthase-like methyltransferase